MEKRNEHQPATQVKSLEKALSILELMIEERRDLSLTEISKKLNLVKGTVHRILDTMKSHQFVRQDPASLKYGMGHLTLKMGTTFQKEEYLVKILNPHLIQLSKLCSETISVSILESREIRYIARIESREVLRVAIGEGTIFPAHCTATGKILLSTLPEDKLRSLYCGKEKLEKLNKNSIGTLSRLVRELAGVRKENIAYDFEEALEGVNCIAKPIRNSKNDVVAAISISGPVSRMTNGRLSELSALLVTITSNISKEL